MDARRLLFVAVPFVVAFVAFFSAELTDACSFYPGWTPTPDGEHVLDAERFLYGRVIRTYRGLPSNPYNTYNAEIDVFCIMKGPRTPARVNITRVGFIPGMCWGTDLRVGRSYVILANGNQLRAYKTFDAGKIDDLIETCGLNPEYPFGVESHVTCPQPAGPGTCRNREYFEQQRHSNN